MLAPTHDTREAIRVDVHLYRDQRAVLSILPDLIHETFRSYRKDRCAVLGEIGLVKEAVHAGLDADYLDVEKNWHWSGIQRRIQKPWKRIVANEYGEWFLWYMKWQRFRAFHTLVLLNPVQYLLEWDFRGYIDGLLARLMSKPLSRIVVVEEERFGAVVQCWIQGRRIDDGLVSKSFGGQELSQAILAMLYGTRLQRTALDRLITRTLWFAANRNTQDVASSLLHLRGIANKEFDGYYRLTEDGARFVEGLEKITAKRQPANEVEIEQLFTSARRKKPVSLPDKWLENQINLILKEREWVTVPLLERLLSEHHEELRKDEDYALREVLEEFEYDTLDEARRRLSPGRPTIRRILEKLAQKGRLEKHLWYREIGRAAIVYYLPGRLPFKAESRCGQCAFYNSLRHRCRLWWLLDKTFHSSNPRWEKEGEHPLSHFEIHKMKNSWRIGPHSSACLRFLDKKRDHKRKIFPESCDTCCQNMLGSKMSEEFHRCTNCGTRYFRMQTGVRVLTSYDHEFRRQYKEISGREPGPDLKKFADGQSESDYRLSEAAEYLKHRTELGPAERPYSRTLVVFPGDKMFVREGKLFVMKRRRVEALPASGTIIVDHLKIETEQRAALEKEGVTIKDFAKTHALPVADVRPKFDPARSIEKIVGENQEFVRGLALAMGKSAIIATRRIAKLADLGGSEVQLLQSVQASLFRRLRLAPPNRFLTYEALIMKQYWRCFDLALRGALEWFGPRKKSRFVRDYVMNPAGRARGYSAVHAAINYLHQRRLHQARMAIMKLGLDWNPGEGFLHRRTKNAKGLGLLLDLIDPFKFADREKLLESMLKYELNWRDFYIASDRVGANFYYPQPQAIDILELKGEEADNLPVHYEGKEMPLQQAYDEAASRLVDFLKTQSPEPYHSFVFGNLEDLGAISAF